MEGAHIYWRLRIGNRESGNGNYFLVRYLVKLIYVSKVQIGNKEPVPYSLFNTVWVYTCLGFWLFHQHVRHAMLIKEITLFADR